MTCGSVENPSNLLRRKKARCASAQENTFDVPVANGAGLVREVADNCVDIATAGWTISRGMRIEIAIRTLVDAPRKVQVQR
jgi:hypothetical protein